MYLMAPDERWLLDTFPPHGVHHQAVQYALREWIPEEGYWIDIIADGVVSGIWLSQAAWQAWCQVQVGTGESDLLVYELQQSLMKWALTPLLTSSGLTLDSDLQWRPCSLLGQLALEACWQQTAPTILRACCPAAVALTFRQQLAQQPSMTPTAVAEPLSTLPLRFHLYAGGAAITLKRLLRLQPGDGMVIQSFGMPNSQVFGMTLSKQTWVKVKIIAETTMMIKQMSVDVDAMLGLNPEERGGDTALPVEALTQMLWVDVGQVELSLGKLGSLKPGDILDISGEFSPHAILRLNGQVVGTGMLIACNGQLLVRIVQWRLCQGENRQSDNTHTQYS